MSVRNAGTPTPRSDYLLPDSSYRRTNRDATADLAGDTDREQQANYDYANLLRQVRDAKRLSHNALRQKLGAAGIAAAVLANAWGNTDKKKPFFHRVGQMIGQNVPFVSSALNHAVRAQQVVNNGVEAASQLKALTDADATPAEHKEAVSRILEHAPSGLKALANNVPLIGSPQEAFPRTTALPLTASRDERMAAAREDLAEHASNLGQHLRGTIDRVSGDANLRELAKHYDTLRNIVADPKNAAMHAAHAVINDYLPESARRAITEVPQQATRLHRQLLNGDTSSIKDLFEGSVSPEHLDNFQQAIDLNRRIPDKNDLDRGLHQLLKERFPSQRYSDDDLAKAKKDNQAAFDNLSQDVSKRKRTALANLPSVGGKKFPEALVAAALHRQGKLSDKDMDDIVKELHEESLSDNQETRIKQIQNRRTILQAVNASKTGQLKNLKPLTYADGTDVVMNHLKAVVPEELHPYLSAAQGDIRPLIAQNRDRILDRAVAQPLVPEVVQDLYKQIKGKSPEEIGKTLKDNFLNNPVAKAVADLPGNSLEEKASNLLQKYSDPAYLDQIRADQNLPPSVRAFHNAIGGAASDPYVREVLDARDDPDTLKRVARGILERSVAEGAESVPEPLLKFARSVGGPRATTAEVKAAAGHAVQVYASRALQNAVATHAKSLSNLTDVSPVVQDVLSKVNDPEELRNYAVQKGNEFASKASRAIVDQLEPDPNGFLHQNYEHISNLTNPGSSNAERVHAAGRLATAALPSPLDDITHSMLDEYHRINQARTEGAALPTYDGAANFTRNWLRGWTQTTQPASSKLADFARGLSRSAGVSQVPETASQQAPKPISSSYLDRLGRFAQKHFDALFSKKSAPNEPPVESGENNASENVSAPSRPPPPTSRRSVFRLDNPAGETDDYDGSHDLGDIAQGNSEASRAHLQKLVNDLEVIHNSRGQTPDSNADGLEEDDHFGLVKHALANATNQPTNRPSIIPASPRPAPSSHDVSQPDIHEITQDNLYLPPHKFANQSFNRRYQGRLGASPSESVPTEPAQNELDKLQDLGMSRFHALAIQHDHRNATGKDFEGKTLSPEDIEDSKSYLKALSAHMGKQLQGVQNEVAANHQNAVKLLSKTPSTQYVGTRPTEDGLPNRLFKVFGGKGGAPGEGPERLPEAPPPKAKSFSANPPPAAASSITSPTKPSPSVTTSPRTVTTPATVIPSTQAPIGSPTPFAQAGVSHAPTLRRPVPTPSQSAAPPSPTKRRAQDDDITAPTGFKRPPTTTAEPITTKSTGVASTFANITASVPASSSATEDEEGHTTNNFTAGETTTSQNPHNGSFNPAAGNNPVSTPGEARIPVAEQTTAQKVTTGVGSGLQIAQGAAQLENDPIQGVANIATGGLGIASLFTDKTPDYTPPPVQPELGSPVPVTYNSANSSANAVVNNALSNA